MKMQRGLTLIELVMIIIALSVLTTVGVPSFIDRWFIVRAAAATDVATTISEGTLANSVAKAAGSTSAKTINAANVCRAVVLAPFAGGVTLVDVAPTTDQSFQIGGAGDCSTVSTSVTCTLKPFGSGVVVALAKITCAR